MKANIFDIHTHMKPFSKATNLGPLSDRYWQIKIIKKHKSSRNSTSSNLPWHQIWFYFCLFKGMYVNIFYILENAVVINKHWESFLSFTFAELAWRLKGSVKIYSCWLETVIMNFSINNQEKLKYRRPQDQTSVLSFITKWHMCPVVE